MSDNDMSAGEPAVPAPEGEKTPAAPASEDAPAAAQEGEGEGNAAM